MAPAECARQDAFDQHVNGTINQFFSTIIATCDPRDDKSRLTGMTGATREHCWIAKSPEFTQWCTDKAKPLFWIKGSLGTGKTVQLCGLLDNLQTSGTNDDITSFFFCQGSDVRKSTTAAVLRGLICTLVQQQPLLAKYTSGKKKKKHQTREEDTMITLAHDLAAILHDEALRKRRVWFIVDSVDECKDMSNLLDFIRQTSSSPSTGNQKWIISSRRVPKVETWAQKLVVVAQLSFDEPRDDMTAVVNTYTRRRVQQLAFKNQYDVETEDAICRYLNEASDRILWIALVCRSLEDVPHCDSLARLREVPHGLQPLYSHTMRKLEISANGNLYKQILATAAVACRPMSLSEMSLYVDIPGDPTHNLDTLIHTVRQCGMFLAIYNDTVYTVHPSATEYLVDNLKASDDTSVSWLDSAHENIYYKSLKHMIGLLRRDIYGLQHPAVTIDQVGHPNPDPLASSKYACIYWVDHLRATRQNMSTDSENNLRDHRLVVVFFQEKYLYWLECLSLLRCLPEGARAMRNLLGFYVGGFSEKVDYKGETPGPSETQSPLPKSLQDLIYDAYHFLMRNMEMIAFAPLQTYMSALLFTPASSLVKEAYSHEKSPLVIYPEMGIKSLTHLTRDSHKGATTSVAFSPKDSRLAVSASVDKSLKIWDAATGKCIRSLDGHSGRISSFSFCQNGQQIASAADDSTVRVWHVSSGRCLQVLDGHGDGAFSKLSTIKAHNSLIWAVALSRNGKLIVSGSVDGTAKIWDFATRELLQVLKHKGPIRSVDFGRNGQVATGSGDRTVKIWNARSGSCLFTLEHSAAILTIKFSVDGQRIVSGSVAKRRRMIHEGVIIWDTATGQAEQKLSVEDYPNAAAWSRDNAMIAVGSTGLKCFNPKNGHLIRELPLNRYDFIYSLVFSKNGRVLASGSLLGLLKLWDVSTGTCLRTLRHGSVIYGVTFTDNGELVLSAAENGEIKIWSTRTGLCLQELQVTSNTDDDVNSLVFSPDGHQLVAGDDVGNITIWDAVLGGPAWSTTFSNNNQWLATCTEGGTVRIWEVLTGECLEVMRHHTDPVYSTSFTHDDQYLAAASADRTVTISNRSGECLKRLEGHRGSVWAVAFTPDDTQIVSASNDRTLRLWDVRRGNCLRVINVGTSLSNISFGASSTLLFTEIGHIDLTRTTDVARRIAVESQPPSESIQGVTTETEVFDDHPYGLSLDRRWVTYGGECILLLPVEYTSSTIAISKDRICIGCESGQVLFLSLQAN